MHPAHSFQFIIMLGGYRLLFHDSTTRICVSTSVIW